jgi:hypothetical protein
MENLPFSWELAGEYVNAKTVIREDCENDWGKERLLQIASDSRDGSSLFPVLLP